MPNLWTNQYVYKYRKENTSSNNHSLIYNLRKKNKTMVNNSKYKIFEKEIYVTYYKPPNTLLLTNSLASTLKLNFPIFYIPSHNVYIYKHHYSVH